MTVGKARLGVAVVAVCSGMVLAGCATTSQPGVTSPPTASPVDPDVQPTQEPTGPPTSQEEALAAAFAVVEADNAAYFHVLNGAVQPESVFVFEGGSYLEATFGFLEALLPDPGFIGVEGQPHRWVPDHTSSSVSTLVFEGESYPYGSVHLVGCLEIGWTLILGPGASGASAAIGEVLPSERTVEYDPTQRVWLITDAGLLTGQPGAPECLPAAP